MKHRLVIIATAFAIVFGSAATALAYRPIDQWACFNSGTARCIQHHLNGLQVTTQNNVGLDDRLSWYAADISCNNGRVSPTQACPFPNGSGSNSQFAGDNIGCLRFDAGGYIQDQGSGYADQPVITGNCGDTGTFFVEHNSSWVNVHDSSFGPNYLVFYLTGPPSNGSALNDQGFVSGRSNWAPCSSC
jgi:hypothetical protein